MPANVLQSTNAPIKIWSPIHEVESSALDQLRNTASLPFIFKHVAVMPDVHYGIGATVGSVVATKGAIVPACVGVDIGCFTGDTMIPTLGGEEYSLKELSERQKECVVYSCTNTGKIVASRATSIKTRSQADLLMVTLDSGREIRCTPDHQFMLRDGTYIEANQLSAGASLMPLYRGYDKGGYEYVQQNYSGRNQKTHWMVARSGFLGEIPGYGKGGTRTIIHHKNFDSRDNLPENLEFMSASEHSRYHRSLVDRNTTWQSESFEKKRTQALSNKANTAEGHVYFAERGTKNILKYMHEQPEHFRNAVAGNGKRGSQYLVDYNTSVKGRAKSKEISNRMYSCGICSEEIRSGLGVHNHRRWVHGINHTVISVEILLEKEDVYCLVVPGINNFALSAGVFVHNCGMMAAKMPFKSKRLPDNLRGLFDSISKAVPVGQDMHRGDVRGLDTMNMDGYLKLPSKIITEGDSVSRVARQLGTLGGGNHFIEVCLDLDENVWVMLHSGSRGIGNKIGNYYIDQAKKIMDTFQVKLVDPNLAYLHDGSELFDEYWRDLQWAQRYAMKNREVMMALVMRSIAEVLFGDKTTVVTPELTVNCHHNYAEREDHYGENVIVTRKGAVRARVGDMGIIPGSMGTRSYIVEGLGNAESFCSCSHGAGRVMSRGKAKKSFTLEDVEKQTAGIMCRKDAGIIDELPGAYKDLDKVMENQSDLVKIVAQLRQVLCVKG